MAKSKEGAAALLLVMVMLSIALITVAYSETSRNQYNWYQLPSGMVRVTINSNVTRDWNHVNVTFSNGRTSYQSCPGDTWLPTYDWLGDAVLPWVLYIPSNGYPTFYIDYDRYWDLPLPVGMNVTHVGNIYVCHVGHALPGDLSISWDDRSGILTEIDSSNLALVWQVSPYP
jgi:hypothetical protein